jgi:dipeptidyl aminopeptidase/acylaminoacyl peptidase
MKPLDSSPDASWRARFKVSVVAFTQTAGSNPQRGLAVTNRTGTYQLHRWDTQSGQLSPLTDAPAGVVFGGISPDGQWVYYLKDEQGNEIGHFVRVPWDAAPDAAVQDVTPDMPPYSSYSLGQSLDGRVLGFSAASGGSFDIYTVQVAPDGTLGQRSQLYHSERLTGGPVLSYDGQYAVVFTTERSTGFSFALYALRVDQPRVIQQVLQDPDSATVEPVAFAPLSGDTRLLASTNLSGFTRPVIWDVQSGQRTDIPLEDLAGDVFPWGWSPDGQRILLCNLANAQYQLYVYDVEKALLHRLAHPSGTFNSGYYFDADTIYVNMQDSQHPTQVVALDATSGAQKAVVLPASGQLPPSRKWRSVTFESAPGVMIQAWVATPDGQGPWPMILETHGGPTAVETETYDAVAQAWLDHGFAFMSVNYRGSVTFGREFEQSIWGNLGTVEVDDMAAAYQWAVHNQIAQPDAVLLTGGSYGGYLTLQALGRRPELWAGGMALVAIADWRLMYEDQAETLRGYQRSLFGGTPDEKPEAHRVASPITYAEQVRAPILVIQGANDTRCPARQMRVYEEKLKALGKDIHVEWFDAGHGSRVSDERLKHMELMLNWAYRVLG